MSAPSRFLSDVPAELTDSATTSVRRRNAVSRASTWSDMGSSGRNRHRSRRKAPDVWGANQAAGAGAETRKSMPVPRAEMDDLPDDRLEGKTTRPQYHSGQRVRHARFGEGMVIESKMTGNDEEVTVAFADEGIKRLAASFANLELLE